MDARFSKLREGRVFLAGRRIKRWQLVVLLVIGAVALSNLAESLSSSASNLPSWAWLFAIPLVVVLIFTGRKLQRTHRVRVEANRIDALREDVAYMHEALEFFQNHESQYDESMPSGIVAKKGENVIGVVSEVGLVETETLPSQFRGGSTGASFRLTDRLSVRQSAFRGRSIPGEEVPAVIDVGQFIVTDQRGVFVGTKQSREFAWDNLLSYDLAGITNDSAILYLPTSNRQKTSGVAADAKSIRQVHQRVAFGVAVAMSRKEQFLEHLRKEIAEAEAELAATVKS